MQSYVTSGFFVSVFFFWVLAKLTSEFGVSEGCIFPEQEAGRNEDVDEQAIRLHLETQNIKMKGKST